MKKGFFAVLAVLTVLAMVMTGCSTESKPNSKAVITSLKLDGQTATLGEPITEDEWAELSDLDSLALAKLGVVSIAEDNENATIVIKASSGAKVDFATSLGGLPTEFAGGKTLNAETGTTLVVRVRSQNKSNTNYYAIRIEQINANTTLSGIKIAKEITQELQPIQPGASKDTAAEAVLKQANLSNRESQGATVELVFGSTFRGTAKIAKLGKGDTVSDATVYTAYNAASKPTYNFTDGDKLYIQMTAVNGETVKYYGFEVKIGWDADVLKVSFSNGTKNQDADTLGNPKTSVTGFDGLSVDSEDLGKTQFSIGQPPLGFTVSVTPNDLDAIATISKDGSTFAANDTTLNWDVNDDNNFLYVKVVSQNKQVTQFYKINLALKRVTTIEFGKPPKPDASGITNDNQDKKPGGDWDKAEWVYIDRINPAEGSGLLAIGEATRSHGRAKLLWDENGVWVYAQVWEKNVSTAASEHNASSVEVFINESGAVSGAVTGDNNTNGGQYRLGANNDLSGAPNAAVNEFKALVNSDPANIKYSAVKYLGKSATNDADNGVMIDSYKKNSTLDTGYILIFQVPWRFPDRYEIVDQHPISIELQINATSPVSGSRIGVLNWNNITSNSYSTLKDYGEAFLNLGGATLPAMNPRITTQPANQKMAVENAGAVTNFTVAAVSPDKGTISYKWYKGNSDGTFPNTTPSTFLSTEASYKPTDATKGKFYYYVEVTNTKAGETKTVRSNMVVLNLKDYSVKPTANKVFNCNFPSDLSSAAPITNRYVSVYVADFGADFEADDYASMSIDIQFLGKDKTVIPPGKSGQLTLKWWDAARSAIINDAYNIGSTNNTTLTTFDKAPIPPGIITASQSGREWRFLDFDSGDQSQPSIADAERIEYMKITSITFYPAPAED